jgi:hypothetical protein
MLGKYEIEIYNNRVHYFLTIKRNITILKGDSATGKTELIRLISEYELSGVSSGITLSCDVKCRVLTAADWELRFKIMKNCIIFIDETAAFIHTKRFAELVKGSDNYFVIVTRDELSQLPYSIDEIYGFRDATDTQKYKTYRRIYNEMYKLYNLENNQDFTPEFVITEDSNSGFEFFNILYSGKCVSAHGKSNVCDQIRESNEKKILAIVDGAAFGCEMGKIFRYLQSNKIDCIIYAPESFEYLVLRVGIFDIPQPVLSETYQYADSTKYMSWEEFYTAYLADITRNSVAQYGKAKLADYYKTEGVLKRIEAVIPEKMQ